MIMGRYIVLSRRRRIVLYPPLVATLKNAAASMAHFDVAIPVCAFASICVLDLMIVCIIRLLHLTMRVSPGYVKSHSYMAGINQALEW